MSKEKARDWLLRSTNYFTDGGDEHQLAPPLTFKELCELLQEYADSVQNEQGDALLSHKVKELLSDAYASGWRKSKKHQKRSNFLGLNRKEINEIFEVWYYSKMWHRIHEPQTDKEQKIINP